MHTNQRGFTLIELIIVMALISVLAGFFVMDSRNARRLQRLDVATNTLVSTIREVQTWGQSGRGYGVVDSEYYDRGYGVYVTTDAGDDNKIFIYGGAGDGKDGVGVPEPDEDKYDIGREVSVITLPVGVVVKSMCIERTVGPPDTCDNKDSVQILTRRGLDTMNIHHFQGSSTNWLYSDYTRITLEAGSDTKIVRVNKFGLVYVE